MHLWTEYSACLAIRSTPATGLDPLPGLGNDNHLRLDPEWLKDVLPQGTPYSDATNGNTMMKTMGIEEVSLTAIACGTLAL